MSGYDRREGGGGGRNGGRGWGGRGGGRNGDRRPYEQRGGERGYGERGGDRERGYGGSSGRHEPPGYAREPERFPALSQQGPLPPQEDIFMTEAPPMSSGRVMQAPAGPSLPPAQQAYAEMAMVAVPPRPLRPGFGKEGRPFKLTANWFTLEMRTSEMYQYAVHIKKVALPEAEGGSSRPPRAASGALPALLCRAAMQAMAKEMNWKAGSWAFDGRANMYTADTSVVPNDMVEREVETTLPGEKRPVRFQIKLERSAILPMSLVNDFFKNKTEAAPHHVLQALDVILKHRMGQNTLTRPDIMALGRSFLMYTPRDTTLGGGAEVWLGYKQAVRPCQTGLALTLDTAAGAVWDVGNPAKPCRLSDLIYKVAGNVGPNGLSPQQQRTLDRELRGLKIRAVHNGFKRAVVGFARTTPFTERFAASDGKETTVAQYFQDQYKVSIRDRNLPCVRVGNGKVLLPPEICEVLPKQRYGKLNGDQTAGMIKHCAERPGDKLAKLQDKIREVGKEASDEMRAFGLNVKGEMAQVNGRILPHPTLAYSGKSSYDPKNFGSWNLRDIKFLQGTSIPSWAVVSFADKRWEKEGLGPFIPEFVRGLRNVSVQIADRPPVIQARPSDPVDKVLSHAAQQAMKAFKTKPRIILVVLPDTGAALYKEVKQTSDSLLGIPSQCIVARKAGIGDRNPRGQLQYIANVALKMNAKVGGVNVGLSPNVVARLPPFLKDFRSKPFMLMGADVTHPLPGSQAPSLAAVVASLDGSCGKYAARVSAQPTAPGGKQIEEIIQDLRGMTRDLLMEFYKSNNGKKPESIVFYRDGVSEGQFDHVSKFEYSAIRQACLDVAGADSGYAPPITICVVQKRHQTRLFCMDPRQADRSGNVPPGVVVDTGICHPHEFDFYLNAHAGLQGTNRPVHFHVLVDQNKFGADNLQLFTYHLCYLFCRCTRSISVCPPAMYAHLAAFRARVLMRGGESDVSSVSSGGSGAGQLMPVHQDLGQTMFFV